MQEKKTVIFRFNFEDKEQDFKVSSNEFSENMYIIEFILNTFENILQKQRKNGKNLFLIDNKFIFSNFIEIYAHDGSGNSVKFNLIDLFFDNTLLHKGNVNTFSIIEPFLYTEIQKVFFDLPKKIRENITLTHLLFNLTIKYIQFLENLNENEIKDKGRKVLIFLFSSFFKCLDKYNENCLKLNKDFISLYMYNKKNTFKDMYRHLENKLKQSGVDDSTIKIILDLYINRPISIQDKGDAKNREKLDIDLDEIYLKLTEAVKLNSNAVFQVLREFHTLIDNN